MNVETKVKQYLEKIKKEDKKINSFLELNPHVLEEARAVDAKKKKGRLAGYVVAVKSNINVKGLTASCASKTLENHKSTYDATAIEKIKAEDAVIIGMTNMDEFACGSSGEKSAFGPTQNPAAPGYIPGGTSAGSAAAVAAGFCDVALGTDTGGSLRNPASCCGVIGLKPSYGCVSRYGLIDSAMSFDQIGPVTQSVDDALLMLDVIRGKDERDTTTFDSKNLSYASSSFSLGTLSVKGVDPSIQKLIDSAVAQVSKKKKWKASPISIQHVDLAVATYYIIQYVEFFSGTRKFDGRKYGKKIEESAGKEVLRRIYGGSEISKAEFEGRYYHKALEVKELISQEFERVFKEVDCIILPTCPALPWKIGSGMKIEDEYAYDALTVPANLGGICSISIPAGTIKGIPVGLQIMCNKGQESKLLTIAREFTSTVN